MDNQKILIVNLSKGRIGEDSMRLLGGMIVTKIQLGAMGRVEIPEEDRKDFYLYVDEFQNFATESFANILSEARKYKLNLILAHQYINQLIFDGNSVVRDAVFGNVGTLISFRVGAEDAEHLEKEFDPVFLMNDIVNLSKYHIYLKLMIDGVAGDAFSAATLPPLDLADTSDNTEKVIRISRERYGNNKSEVEDRIARWSGMLMDEGDVIVHKVEPASPAGGSDVQKIVRERVPQAELPPIKVMPKNKVANDIVAAEPLQHSGPATTQVAKQSEVDDVQAIQKEKKELYETVCDTCEQKIYVPFKPDPSRPAFCKECLKDYQRAMARSRAQSAPASPVNTQPVNIIKVQPARNASHNEAGGPKTQPIIEKKVEPKAYAPKDRPMSLSQMSHMAPKKFKLTRQKPNVDLEGVRDLLNKTKE